MNIDKTMNKEMEEKKRRSMGELNFEEINEICSVVPKIINETVRTILKIADIYNLNRNELVTVVGESFFHQVCKIDFTDYEIEEGIANDK